MCCNLTGKRASRLTRSLARGRHSKSRAVRVALARLAAMRGTLRRTGNGSRCKGNDGGWQLFWVHVCILEPSCPALLGTLENERTLRRLATEVKARAALSAELAEESVSGQDDTRPSCYSAGTVDLVPLGCWPWGYTFVAAYVLQTPLGPGI